MTFIKEINPTEIAFVTWINSNPASYHYLDMEKFYFFVSTILKHKKTEGKKWTTREYFSKRCAINNSMSNECIGYYYKELRTIYDYSLCTKKYHSKVYYSNLYAEKEYVLKKAINNVIECVEVDKDTFKKGNINNSDFLKLVNKEKTI